METRRALTGGRGRGRLRTVRAAVALILLAAACRERELHDPSIAPGRVSDSSGPGRRILALIPAEGRAGEAFQRQPDGKAGLAVLGIGLTRGDVIHWRGRPLATTFGSSRLLTTAVPVELLSEAGEIPVRIAGTVDPELPALSTTFRLLGPTAPAAGR